MQKEKGDLKTIIISKEIKTRLSLPGFYFLRYSLQAEECLKEDETDKFYFLIIFFRTVSLSSFLVQKNQS